MNLIEGKLLNEINLLFKIKSNVYKSIQIHSCFILFADFIR